MCYSSPARGPMAASLWIWERGTMFSVSPTRDTRETVISTGNGNDTINLHASVFKRPVYINTGGGDDQVNATQVAAADFWLVSGLGTNFFNNQGSAVSWAHIIGFQHGSQPAAPVSPPPHRRLLHHPR
jgi:hypothetical protein